LIVRQGGQLHRIVAGHVIIHPARSGARSK
jgi:hypothetical protein